MGRNVDQAMQQEKDAGHGQRAAQRFARFRLEEKTAPRPPEDSARQEQRGEPAQFANRPEPVAFRMDGPVGVDRGVAGRGEKRLEISQSHSEQRRLQREMKASSWIARRK